ncbi:MAG: hypothetical protein LBU13_10435 [Synergistaceae bacterium]|jgi:hypothetical protein|nr:hypothetical protein [Synergistaceae bacterium]
MKYMRMNRPFKILLALLILAAVCSPLWAASHKEKFKYVPFVSTDPIIPLSSIKPGMKGECRTVLKGDDIVSFDAEVVDILDNGLSPEKLILIRASGPMVEKSGIAAGMSGSPFYIGGRLAGAIGYGFNFTDHKMGLVTPIEEMFEIWNNPEIIPSFEPAPLVAEKPPLDAPASLKDAVSVDVTIEDETPSSDNPPVSGAVSDDHAVSPDYDIRASWDLLVSRDRVVSSDRAVSDDSKLGGFFISGVSGRMAREMKNALGAETVPFGGASGTVAAPLNYTPNVRPGMAVGVSLLWGDVEVSSVGTLTALSKDGRFIAYAHPLLNLGPTAAVLRSAHISSVVTGLDSSFKIGSTGDIIGIVTQDRPQGIGGRIGRFAPAASVVVKMTDVDSGRSYRKSFQIVQDKYLLSKLASPAIVGCIEELWGRVGGGSAKITAEFTGSALRDGWRRTNMFVSENDVATQVLAEFELLTQMFAVNQFQEIRPFGIDVNVEVTQEPRVLYIEDVKISGEGPFKPGEKVSFDITMRPWRKDPFIRTYSLMVPEKVAGMAQLLVRGGGIAEESAEYANEAWRSISSLPILLSELDAKESNDQIIMEIRGQEALDKQIERAKSGDADALMNDKLKSEIRDEKMREGSMRVVRANYYIDGIIQKLIKIDDDDPSPTKAAKQAKP